MMMMIMRAKAVFKKEKEVGFSCELRIVVSCESHVAVESGMVYSAMAAAPARFAFFFPVSNPTDSRRINSGGQTIKQKTKRQRRNG